MKVEHRLRAKVNAHDMRPKSLGQFDIVERTFRFALQIVQLCQEIDGKPGVARTLALQLLRSGTSIGANVEEAQAGQSRADFISKYSIALKEARESAYWLRLLDESNILKASPIEPLRTGVSEIGRILGAIVSKTKRNSQP
jgi:four helix bundle protein